MHILTYIAWFGAAVSMYGTVRYMIGIVRDGTQPRLASWIAWLLANAVMMVMALRHGAVAAVIFDGLSAAGNAGVVVISAVKRSAQKPSGGTDWTCLAVAGGCSLVNAVFPGLALVGTLLAMFANLVATWPTMSHAWHEPHAETWQLFAANAGASLLGVIGVGAAGGMRITTIAGPLVAMIGNITLTAIALGRRVGREIVTEVVSLEAEVVSEVAELEAEAVEIGARMSTELKAAATTFVAAAESLPHPPVRRVRMIGSEAGA